MAKLTSIFWLVTLIVVLLASIGLAVYNLRQNNLKLIDLTAAVAEADEQATDIEAALQALRNHQISHMNSGLNQGARLQLPHKYYRDTIALYRQAVDELDNANSSALLQTAVDSCQDEIEDLGVNCIKNHIDDLDVATAGRVELKPTIENLNGQLASLLPKDYYRFQFASPKWSPDAAGLSILTAVGSGIGLLITITVKVVKSRRRRRLED